MSAILDLDVISVVPGRDSAGGNTHSWQLLDAADHPVGSVIEQRGSMFATLRRQVSSQDYRLRTSYDVVDAAGSLQLVLHREPANRLKTKLAVTAAFPDGTALVTVTDTSTLADVGHFEAVDVAGSPLATLTRDDPTQWVVTGFDGARLGEIAYLPVTRSLVRRDGRDTDRFDCEHRPEASGAVRAAVLGAVIIQSSLRHR